MEPTSPALAGGFFTTEPSGKPYILLPQENYNPITVRYRKIPTIWKLNNTLLNNLLVKIENIKGTKGCNFLLGNYPGVNNCNKLKMRENL